MLNILQYKAGSKSAKSLAEALTLRRGRRVRRVLSSAFLPAKPNRILINWGSANPPQFQYQGIINDTNAVNVAGNKLLAFQKLKDGGVLVPEFTADQQLAQTWLEEGHIVVVRHELRGHSGNGIELVDRFSVGVPRAPLYVQYKKKKHEFRVHVFDGQVIDIQEKKKERDSEQTEVQKKIRSHANGWVFCRENLNLDGDKRERLSNIAINAIRALALDFGAVDIIYNQKENQFYVLEVNTAPGLEGRTLEVYTNAIINLGV